MPSTSGSDIPTCDPEGHDLPMYGLEDDYDFRSPDTMQLVDGLVPNSPFLFYNDNPQQFYNVKSQQGSVQKGRKNEVKSRKQRSSESHEHDSVERVFLKNLAEGKSWKEAKKATLDSKTKQVHSSESPSHSPSLSPSRSAARRVSRDASRPTKVATKKSKSRLPRSISRESSSQGRPKPQNTSKTSQVRDGSSRSIARDPRRHVSSRYISRDPEQDVSSTAGNTKHDKVARNETSKPSFPHRVPSSKKSPGKSTGERYTLVEAALSCNPVHAGSNGIPHATKHTKRPISNRKGRELGSGSPIPAVGDLCPGLAVDFSTEPLRQRGPGSPVDLNEVLRAPTSGPKKKPIPRQQKIINERQSEIVNSSRPSIWNSSKTFLFHNDRPSQPLYYDGRLLEKNRKNTPTNFFCSRIKEGNIDFDDPNTVSNGLGEGNQTGNAANQRGNAANQQHAALARELAKSRIETSRLKLQFDEKYRNAHKPDLVGDRDDEETVYSDDSRRDTSENVTASKSTVKTKSSEGSRKKTHKKRNSTRDHRTESRKSSVSRRDEKDAHQKEDGRRTRKSFRKTERWDRSNRKRSTRHSSRACRSRHRGHRSGSMGKESRHRSRSTGKESTVRDDIDREWRILEKERLTLQKEQLDDLKRSLQLEEEKRKRKIAARRNQQGRKVGCHRRESDLKYRSENDSGYHRREKDSKYRREREGTRRDEDIRKTSRRTSSRTESSRVEIPSDVESLQFIASSGIEDSSVTILEGRHGTDDKKVPVEAAMALEDEELDDADLDKEPKQGKQDTDAKAILEANASKDSEELASKTDDDMISKGKDATVVDGRNEPLAEAKTEEVSKVAEDTFLEDKNEDISKNKDGEGVKRLSTGIADKVSKQTSLERSANENGNEKVDMLEATDASKDEKGLRVPSKEKEAARTSWKDSAKGKKPEGETLIEEPKDEEPAKRNSQSSDISKGKEPSKTGSKDSSKGKETTKANSKDSKGSSTSKVNDGEKDKIETTQPAKEDSKELPAEKETKAKDTTEEKRIAKARDSSEGSDFMDLNSPKPRDNAAEALGDTRTSRMSRVDMAPNLRPSAAEAAGTEKRTSCKSGTSGAEIAGAAEAVGVEKRTSRTSEVDSLTKTRASAGKRSSRVSGSEIPALTPAPRTSGSDIPAPTPAPGASAAEAVGGGSRTSKKNELSDTTPPARNSAAEAVVGVSADDMGSVEGMSGDEDVGEGDVVKLKSEEMKFKTATNASQHVQKSNGDETNQHGDGDSTPFEEAAQAERSSQTQTQRSSERKSALKDTQGRLSSTRDQGNKKRSEALLKSNQKLSESEDETVDKRWSQRQSQHQLSKIENLPESVEKTLSEPREKSSHKIEPKSEEKAVDDKESVAKEDSLFANAETNKSQRRQMDVVESHLKFDAPSTGGSGAINIVSIPIPKVGSITRRSSEDSSIGSSNSSSLDLSQPSGAGTIRRVSIEKRTSTTEKRISGTNTARAGSIVSSQTLESTVKSKPGLMSSQTLEKPTDSHRKRRKDRGKGKKTKQKDPEGSSLTESSAVESELGESSAGSESSGISREEEDRDEIERQKLLKTRQELENKGILMSDVIEMGIAKLAEASTYTAAEAKAKFHQIKELKRRLEIELEKEEAERGRKSDEEEEDEAAQRIQAVRRGQLARRNVKEKKGEGEKDKKHEHKSVKHDKHYKVHNKTKKPDDEKTEEELEVKEEEAAKRIQAVRRGQLARKNFKAKKNGDVDKKAELKDLTNKNETTKPEEELKEEEVAATKMHGSFRKKRAKSASKTSDQAGIGQTQSVLIKDGASIFSKRQSTNARFAENIEEVHDFEASLEPSAFESSLHASSGSKSDPSCSPSQHDDRRDVHENLIEDDNLVGPVRPQPSNCTHGTIESEIILHVSGGRGRIEVDTTTGEKRGATEAVVTHADITHGVVKLKDAVDDELVDEEYFEEEEEDSDEPDGPGYYNSQHLRRPDLSDTGQETGLDQPCGTASHEPQVVIGTSKSGIVSTSTEVQANTKGYGNYDDFFSNYAMSEEGKAQLEHEMQKFRIKEGMERAGFEDTTYSAQDLLDHEHGIGGIADGIKLNNGIQLNHGMMPYEFAKVRDRDYEMWDDQTRMSLESYLLVKDGWQKFISKGDIEMARIEMKEGKERLALLDQDEKHLKERLERHDIEMNRTRTAMAQRNAKDLKNKSKDIVPEYDEENNILHLTEDRTYFAIIDSPEKQNQIKKDLVGNICKMTGLELPANVDDAARLRKLPDNPSTNIQNTAHRYARMFLPSHVRYGIPTKWELTHGRVLGTGEKKDWKAYIKEHGLIALYHLTDEKVAKNIEERAMQFDQVSISTVSPVSTPEASSSSYESVPSYSSLDEESFKRVHHARKPHKVRVTREEKKKKKMEDKTHEKKFAKFQALLNKVDSLSSSASSGSSMGINEMLEAKQKAKQREREKIADQAIHEAVEMVITKRVDESIQARMNVLLLEGEKGKIPLEEMIAKEKAKARKEMKASIFEEISAAVMDGDASTLSAAGLSFDMINDLLTKVGVELQLEGPVKTDPTSFLTTLAHDAQMQDFDGDDSTALGAGGIKTTIKKVINFQESRRQSRLWCI